MSASDQPPLATWIAAILLAGSAMAVLSSERLGMWVHHAESDAQGDLINVARLTQVPAARAHVVAIGSSKTFYAVDFDDRFAARLAGSDTPLQFSRLTWLSAQLPDIDRPLRALTEHPPAVLLLESDLVVIDREGRFPVRDHLRALGHYVWQQLPVPHEDPKQHDYNYRFNRGLDEFPTAEACAERHSRAELESYARMAGAWRLRAPAKLESWLSVLRKLKAEGTVVVLLNLPRSPAAAAVFPHALDRDIEQQLDTLAATEGFEHWRAPQPPETDYCDEGHFLPGGREHVSRWLAEQLRQRLALPHD